MNDNEINKLVEIANNLVLARKGESLNDIQKAILEQALEGKRLKDIQVSGYADDYIQKTIAQNLWKLLSEVTGKKVGLKKVRLVLQELKKQAPHSDKILLQTPISAKTINPGVVKSLSKQNSASTNATPLPNWLSNSSTPPNPFYKKGRIVNPDDFFDREELLLQMFDALAKGSSLSLVGEEQIGKSSILSMVCNWGSERLNLPTEAFIYLDMQFIRDEDEFFKAISRKLGIETCRGFDLAHQLEGKRYILCIDEIEKMTRKECFSGQEREELRGLADGADAAFTLVTASRSPLDKIFADYPGITSPLDNICRRIDVGPFLPEVARAFLNQRLRGTGVLFNENQIKQLLEETQCHPARLQMAAGDLYDKIVNNPSQFQISDA